MVKVYLDLEETLVHPLEGWTNANLYPAVVFQRIKEIIQRSGNRKVGIFSFAIQSPFDVRAFNADLKYRIEQLIDAEIDEVLIVERPNVPRDQQKVEAFYKFARNKAHDMILIDDTVEDQIYQGSFKIQFIDARNLLLASTSCK